MAVTPTASTLSDMEIHLTNGLCKIIQGNARRVFYSTEEAVGLALLKLHGVSNIAREICWVDFLSTKGLAVGMAGNKVFTLLTIPAKKRTISYAHYGEDLSESRDYIVTFPACLLAVTMEREHRSDSGEHMIKALLYVIHPDWLTKLTTTLGEASLAPFPYGNVYNHATICWGTTAISDIHHSTDVEEMFFGTTFNKDLWHPRDLVTACGNLPEFIAQTKGKLTLPTSFPTSVTSAIAQLVRS